MVSNTILCYTPYRLAIAFCVYNLASGSASDYRSRGREFEYQPGHVTFAEIENETISTAIPLPLIQEWQLPVTGEIVKTFSSH